jgi:hypothetical protein
MLLSLGTDCARAEIFILASGGRVVGELVNRDEKPRKTYIIELADGSRMTLEAAQVESVQKAKPELLEYEKIRPDYADTVEGQWSLAEWCREKKLPDKREVHLKRIIELEPDHADARRVLGYTKIDGKWARRDDVMKERGYVLYKGNWVLPQVVEQQAEKAKADAAAVEWARQIGQWKKMLGTKNEDKAKENFQTITDAAAVKPLVIALRNEKSPEIRILFIEGLRNIETPEAERAMTIAAIDDGAEEVRMTCLDFLKTKKRPESVAYFVGKLKAKDNDTVNLAGVALREMKDPSSIPPLIDALQTTHKFKVQQGGGEGSLSPTFGNGPGGGGGGLSVGGRPKIIYRTINNQAVLDALVAITGKNYAFDQASWKAWLAAQKTPDNGDVRRN